MKKIIIIFLAIFIYRIQADAQKVDSAKEIKMGHYSLIRITYPPIIQLSPDQIIQFASKKKFFGSDYEFEAFLIENHNKRIPGFGGPCGIVTVDKDSNISWLFVPKPRIPPVPPVRHQEKKNENGGNGWNVIPVFLLVPKT